MRLRRPSRPLQTRLSNQERAHPLARKGNPAGVSGKIRVRLSHQYPQFPLLRQTPGGMGWWGRCEFVQDLEDGEGVDFWVVCEGVLEKEYAICAPENVLLVTWEPPGNVRPPYKKKFLRQFGGVVTCDPEIRHRTTYLQHQSQPWFVNRSFDELLEMEPPPKPHLLSVVTSNKARTKGHRYRLSLAQALKEHFGDTAHLLGRGFADFEDKWDALGPYRYSLAVENTVMDNYITEKLSDCYLSFTHPLYVGAPNVQRYYPEASLTRIPYGDVETAVSVIDELLGRADHWESSLPAMIAARRAHLIEQQLFPMLGRLLQRHALRVPASAQRLVEVAPEFPRHDLLHRARSHFGIKLDRWR